LSLRDFAAELFAEAPRERRAEHAPAPDAHYSIIGIPARTAGEVVLVFTDLAAISRREQAEREFVANAAHELQTPLTAISGAIEVLQSGAKELPADRDLFLGDIEREATRLRRLTRALLLLAEIQAQREPPAVEPIDLRAFLEETALGMRVREGVAVEVECEPGSTAWTNPDLAAQALATVAANAAKYTLAGRISLSASADDEGATIVVADTGPGIAPEERGRLFERFYRAGESGGEGFGLGLSIARQAVESLGGTIDVQASREGGTAVVLRLPARR
jgi:signal transduction histidine kinase